MSVCILELHRGDLVYEAFDTDGLPCALCGSKILRNVFFLIFLPLSFVTARGFIVTCTLRDIHHGVWSRGSAVSGFLNSCVDANRTICSENYSD